MFAIRAVLAATMSPTWGVYSGYELFEHQAVREGSEEYLDSEKYELRPRDFEAALASGESLEPFLARLNEIRRLHPALQPAAHHHVPPHRQRRAAGLQQVRPDHRRLRAGGGDAQPVRPGGTHSVAGHGRARAWSRYDRFWVRDEVTGDEYQWGQANYVRIDPVRAVAHVLNMPQIPPEQRLQLLRRD